MTQRRRTGLGRTERDAYLIDRTLADARAYQRGGLGALLLKLGRRPVRRRVGRATKGWL